MRTAVCPGSFDPITNGHLDIIQRAASLFDSVIVLILHNPAKEPCFSLSQRMDFIRKATQDYPQVRVDYYDGLLADYMRKTKANAIIKGLRAMSDFEYEFQMALANKKLYPEAETLFLTTQTENMYVSSSLIRQIGSLHGDISDLIPPVILQEVKQVLNHEED